MRPFLLVLVALAGCSGNRPDARGTPGDSDSAFTRVQTRGGSAMGVDQYTSTHHFEPLPDGGRISLERNVEDSAGIAQIRAHMGMIAAAFARGDFTLPGFVHDRDVPGTGIMAARRSRISYRADPLPRGAALRIISHDSAAIEAVHQFLAFQRRDHRADHAPNAR
jgi:hypothetical protein